jgi:hypothetical protein
MNVGPSEARARYSPPGPPERSAIASLGGILLNNISPALASLGPAVTQARDVKHEELASRPPSGPPLLCFYCSYIF